MKCCVSTDVGTWTNWLTFERDPNHSALGVSHIMRYINARYLIYILTYIIRMPEPDCFLRYHIGYGTLQHCLCCQRAALLRENMNRHTLTLSVISLFGLVFRWDFHGVLNSDWDQRKVKSFFVWTQRIVQRLSYWLSFDSENHFTFSLIRK